VDGHASAEHSRLDVNAVAAELVAESLVEWLGPLLRGCAREVGASSPLAFAIGDKGELRDGERLAARVEDAPVELAVLVLEDAQPGDAAGEPLSRRLVVRRRDAEKDADARADRRNDLAGELDARLADALDDGPQC
jgi:hypothetical protein